MEKYGNEAVYDAINERSYNYNYYNRDMDSPGTTSSYNGAKGFMKSLPSFLLCALISPPLAGIMLLGALFHRVNQKWHDHDSAIAMMNPFTWAEYLATGNYIPKGMDKPFWTAGENAKAKNIEKVEGDSSAMGAALANSQINENVPEEEAGSLIYNYHWLFFDNGEIRKTKCYTEEDAKRAALTYLKKQNRNDKQNEGARINYEGLNEILKKDKEYSVYVCEYDDGQLIYCIGKTENDAKIAADNILVGIAQYFKKNIDPTYEIPKIKYVTETNWDQIKPMTNYKGCSRSKPMHKEILSSHRSTESYYWDFDNFKQYTLTMVGGLAGLIRFKIPAVYSQKNTQAGNIAKEIFNKTNTVLMIYINSIHDANYDTVWYNVKSFDGDSYIIPCTGYDNKDEEIKYALTVGEQLFKLKMQALRSIMSNEEITKVIEYAQKHGMTGNAEKQFKVISLKSSADEDNKRCVKELTFDKETKVSGQLNVERVKTSETKFIIPFLDANEKLKIKY